MSSIDSYELTDFNIQGQIKLGAGLGLVKLAKSDDGKLILICDNEYREQDEQNPTPMHITDADSVLGFVLDIGIQREKRLTFGNGYYFGVSLTQKQSMRKIEQKDFDPTLFKKLDTAINGYFKSGDSEKELEAIRINHLLDGYNKARLLFPEFYNDSYLGMMRILDALYPGEGSCDFALAVALISPSLNTDIYTKIHAVTGYANRLTIAEKLFNDCFQRATTSSKKPWPCASGMAKLDSAGKLVFACFYSAYQYRNKFVHNGFPFPNSVKDALGAETDEGTAYLYPAHGTLLPKISRPTGYQDGDAIDIHNIIEDPKEAQDFKDKFFLLLPTWYYLKRMTREALIFKINQL